MLLPSRFRPSGRNREPEPALATEHRSWRRADPPDSRWKTLRYVEEPTVEEVLRFEDLPLGSAGSRRAIVRWSDGTESAALTFYADEVLFCEGDLVGKMQSQIRSVHFGRDRDWLQS